MVVVYVRTITQKNVISINQIFYYRHKCENIILKCLNFIIKPSHLPSSKDDKVSLLRALIIKLGN
jgi:hypothetical protein